MSFVGIDIGSLSTKAVSIADGKIERWAIVLTGPDPESSAREVADRVLEKNGTQVKTPHYVVATGYGRIKVSFANKNITEISCHARGTHLLFPGISSVLDMGGQDCKAIKFDAQGKVTNFLLNDRCAAGTGRYIERIASTLGVPLEEIGPRSLEAVKGAARVDSTCTVFAQRDILQLRQEGTHINDIIAGACDALVRRIISMLERIGIENELSISGGIAKNTGVVKRLEDYFQLEAKIFSEPQIVGAIGAALFAEKAFIDGERAFQSIAVSEE